MFSNSLITNVGVVASALIGLVITGCRVQFGGVLVIGYPKQHLLAQKPVPIRPAEKELRFGR